MQGGAAVATGGARERIVTLDVVRGVAVMGILSVNIVDFSAIQAVYLNPAALGWPDPASLSVWAANMLLVDGKFRTLFSMLFGASMLLVIEHAVARGESGWGVHWRRMAVLLAIGILHATLVWRGDILTLYASVGFLAFCFRNCSVRKLLRWAIGLSLLSVLLFAAIGVTIYFQDKAAHAPGAAAEVVRNWNANAGSFFPSADKVAKDMAIYDRSWWTMAGHQLSHSAQLIPNTILFLPETLGLMLFGMAGYRSGFLTGEWSDQRYRRIAAWGIAIGLAGFAAVIAADLATRFYVPVMLGGFLAATAPFRIVMAFGYAALLVLVTRPMGRLTRRFAAVGRAAFSNYLGTSIVATAIFYGWGLGLYGDVSRAEAWLFVPVFWLAMLAWSKPWLDRFHYGPLEWAWRSLARGRPQPMRKPDPSAALPAGAS